MIETILYLIGAAFMGALGKDLYDRIKLNRHSRRCLVATNVRNNCKKLIDLVDYPEIPFHSLEKHIIFALQSKNGGVRIMGAPAGSGKSTYLDRCIKMFMEMPQQSRKVCVYKGVNILINRSLHEALGVSRLESISDYIPRGTVIVIDQVDCSLEAIDISVQQFIVDLATESRNLKCFSLIICVSNPQVMLKLLKLNEMEKIKDVCDPRYLRWTTRETEHYIDEAFIGWSDFDKRLLVDACEKSKSPGVLFDAHEQDLSRIYSHTEIIEFTKNLDNIKHEKWLEFEKVLQDYPFSKPFKK